MKIVITGGIGSGKSTVTQLLGKLLPEFKILSIDKLVESMYENPEIGDRLIERLGSKDKKVVSDIVFRDKILREAVEQLFATQIRLAINQEMALYENVIIEFPLLFEKGQDLIGKFDYIVSVMAEESLRTKRVMERNSFSLEKVKAIIAAQIKDYERLDKSNYAIYNEGDLNDLTTSVENLAYELRIAYAIQNKQRVGVISGSFDPITLGHQSIIERALNVVDLLVIAVARNPQKKYMFSETERIELIKRSLEEQMPNLNRIAIKVIPEGELTVTFAESVGASFIFRGLRGVIDLDYENQLDLVQKRIAPNIDTIYLITSRELIEISSSMIKSSLQYREWMRVAKPYVSSAVFQKLSDVVDKE